MFAEAAELIRSQNEVLSRLDSQCGDGDHGTTMMRAMETLEAATGSSASARNLSETLREGGWNVMGVDGGASSALLGSFISGMGDTELGDAADCATMARSLKTGLQSVLKRTKAKPGDKTMMDALIPAVEAFEAAAADGAAIGKAMNQAAAAAEAGAASTKNLVARHGRAKYLGEKTLGCADAGATSMALLFRGFGVALAKTEEN
ncbi:MAG TPA: dihydroxyacetone kinase subunit DhaL [Terracidiphilus sp.]|jgi:dihydroxyacetone kinase-like protein|nr:dihydroxyacetone kinase subunit DhaL [Terracidiphilus sp.]